MVQYRLFYGTSGFYLRQRVSHRSFAPRLGSQKLRFRFIQEDAFWSGRKAWNRVSDGVLQPLQPDAIRSPEHERDVVELRGGNQHVPWNESSAYPVRTEVHILMS